MLKSILSKFIFDSKFKFLIFLFSFTIKENLFVVFAKINLFSKKSKFILVNFLISFIEIKPSLVLKLPSILNLFFFFANFYQVR